MSDSFGADTRISTAASALAAQSREFAAQLTQAVVQHYLEYRRVYYHEANPSLATVPPKNAEDDQTESAKLAQNALRLVPREVKSLPVIRDLIDHLQWVVDIHTLTERERTALHNITMIFLYGINDGIQDWYINWLLTSARELQHATHPMYYLAFPWQALLYRTPDELAAFDDAVRTNTVAAIEQEIGRLADQLIYSLDNPLEAQEKFAFAGPDGARHKMLFDLKTSAGLALGAYLAVESARTLLNPQQRRQPLQSVIEAFPPEVTARLLPEEPE